MIKLSTEKKTEETARLQRESLLLLRNILPESIAQR